MISMESQQAINSNKTDRTMHTNCMGEMDHNLFHSDLEFQFPIHLTLIDRLKIVIDNVRNECARAKREQNGESMSI